MMNSWFAVNFSSRAVASRSSPLTRSSGSTSRRRRRTWSQRPPGRGSPRAATFGRARGAPAALSDEPRLSISTRGSGISGIMNRLFFLMFFLDPGRAHPEEDDGVRGRLPRAIPGRELQSGHWILCSRLNTGVQELQVPRAPSNGVGRRPQSRYRRRLFCKLRTGQKYEVRGVQLRQSVNQPLLESIRSGSCGRRGAGHGTPPSNACT
eukprot:COSAG04_NODE_748_length_10610_cov_13.629436_2_plen_208_part_00